MRPWEASQGRYPWQTSGEVVYNRTISIFRDPGFSAGGPGLGQQPYQQSANGGDSSVFAGEPLFSGVVCSIQEASQGGNEVVLPGNAKGSAGWKIYVPLSALALGSVHADDFLLDDLSVRYHVVDPYWDGLGYRLSVETLET